MNKNMCTMYIVRHGETEWNVQKRVQGQKDLPLTNLGINQAKILGTALSHIHFDAIFSSDLSRAYDTAKEIALQNKLAIMTSTLLREKTYGTFEGKQISDLKEFDDVFNELTHEEKLVYKMHDSAESDQEVIERFLQFIKEVAVRYAGKIVLLVTHGAVMKAFLVHIGFAAFKNLPHGSIKNTAHIVLSTDGIEFTVKETTGITLSSASK